MNFSTNSETDLFAVESLTRQVAGQASQVAIQAELDERRRGQGYDESSALERMLIERMLMCWLRMQPVEMQYTTVLVDIYTLKRVEHYEKRVSAAQRRYLQAVQTLGRVRKLAQNTPALQFNIGGQQVVM